MDRKQAERISARLALAAGFAITIGVWTHTGYADTEELTSVGRETAAVTASYDQAQQLLATIRTQVLLTSVRVRDALLAGSRTVTADSREQAEESFHLIQMALEDYEPVAGSGEQEIQLLSLRTELDRFHQACIGALAFAPARSPKAIREVLNRALVPTRDTALAISEKIQTLNREAYIAKENTAAGLYQSAERSSRSQLGIALAVGLLLLLSTGFYAARLDSHLTVQLQRAARLSRQLHDTEAQLLAARAESGRIAPVIAPPYDRDPDSAA